MTANAVLKSLLGTDSTEFRQSKWPMQAYCYQSDPNWFSTLAGLEILQNEEAWLDRVPGLTRFPDTKPLSRSEAKRRHRAGESLYLVGLDRVDEGLRSLCDGLAKDLALAPQYVSIEAWSAGAATTVHWHYDLDFNFNVQIVGEKEWRTSSYLSAEHPLQSFHADTSSVKNAKSPRRELPEEVLKSARSWDLVPGDVMYLPPGVWHATRASTATLAVAFVITPPTWAEHLARTLLERMHREGKWRERVLGAQNLSNQNALRTMAREALAAAQIELAELGPAEMMFRSFWSGEAQSVQVSADAEEIQFERVDTKTILSWHNETNFHQIEVPSWARPPVVQLIEHGAPQSVARLHDTVSATDVPFLNAFITRLINAGLLERVSQ